MRGKRARARASKLLDALERVDVLCLNCDHPRASHEKMFISAFQHANKLQGCTVRFDNKQYCPCRLSWPDGSTDHDSAQPGIR